MSDKISEYLAEQKRLAEAQAFAYSEMLAIGKGVGGLGVRSPELFEDMITWGEATENAHADTVLRLVAALEAVSELHPKVRSVYADQDYVCGALGCIDTGMGDQLEWPCPTIRAIESTLENDEGGQEAS